MSLLAVIVLAAISATVALGVLQVVLEPRRRRRVLWALQRNKDWMFGLDIARQTSVWAVYVTLAALEDQGLVERQTIDDPAGPDRGFLPRTRYRLTDQGRIAAAG